MGAWCIDEVFEISAGGNLMNQSIKILGIAGSLRRQSYNRSALRAAKQLLPEGATLEIFELDNIPAFNEDLEQDPPANAERSNVLRDGRRG